jgi:oxygen-independent coproporphyrinogen III oxidase
MNDLGRAPTAAYVHIPFCLKKCSYCDFVSYPGQLAEKRLAYALSLTEEIRRTAEWAAGQPDLEGRPFLGPLETVYFGGGTPTVLEAGELARILRVMDAAFGLAPDCECTLEANPGTVSSQGLLECREAGFSRISFGLQAAQPHLLKTLGRLHSPADFQKGVEMAARSGYRSISADIMIGVPGQTLEDVAGTLRFLLELPVSHVSFYSLTLEEGTPLWALLAEDPGLALPEELEREQYELVSQTLRDSGFDHYEISNAAKPGHRCRHNLVYWQGRPYYGFGAAAHGFVQGLRRANTGNLDEYIRLCGPVSGDDAENPAPSAFAASQILEVIDEKTAQNEMLFLGLRLLEGVRYADFADRFGIGLLQRFSGRIRRLADRGLLMIDEKGIRLTRIGLDLANQVFMEFLKD